MLYRIHTNHDLQYHFYIHVGAQSPNSPSSLRAINVGLNSATIEWTVYSIRYTPETYIVKYGPQSILLEESEPVKGSFDIVTRNQVFSVNLTGLFPGTYYSFVVVANNGYGSRTSSRSGFWTGGRG